MCTKRPDISFCQYLAFFVLDLIKYILLIYYLCVCVCVCVCTVSTVLRSNISNIFFSSFVFSFFRNDLGGRSLQYLFYLYILLLSIFIRNCNMFVIIFLAEFLQARAITNRLYKNPKGGDRNNVHLLGYDPHFTF